MSQAQTFPPRFVDVAAFEQWTTTQPGDWELHDGVPVAMAPERADHARIELQACIALRDEIRRKNARCEAMVDGMMVQGPGVRQFRPDVVVARGERLDGNARTIPEPMILVEVLSPSTEDTDTGLKLESYLGLPSVQHYLIVFSTTRRVVHHRRWDGSQFLTAIHRTGTIALDPPGLSFAIDDVYAGTNLDPTVPGGNQP